LELTDKKTANGNYLLATNFHYFINQKFQKQSFSQLFYFFLHKKKNKKMS